MAMQPDFSSQTCKDKGPVYTTVVPPLASRNSPLQHGNNTVTENEVGAWIYALVSLTVL